MRNLLIACSIILLAASCFKPFKTKRPWRYYGYIYNINDSLPFVNTEFKIYDQNSINKLDDDSVFLFRTDANGYFDCTIYFSGTVCWPSFRYSGNYPGPPPLDVIYDGSDSVTGIWTSVYEAYTKPYF